MASKLEVDVFELVVCRKGGYNVSLADYSYVAIWRKITASSSLAKAGEIAEAEAAEAVVLGLEGQLASADFSPVQMVAVGSSLPEIDFS